MEGLSSLQNQINITKIEISLLKLTSGSSLALQRYSLIIKVYRQRLPVAFPCRVVIQELKKVL